MGKSAKVFKVADSRPEKRRRNGNPSIMGVEKVSKHDARKQKQRNMDSYQKAIASAKSKRKGEEK